MSRDAVATASVRGGSFRRAHNEWRFLKCFSFEIWPVLHDFPPLIASSAALGCGKSYLLCKYDRGGVVAFVADGNK